MPKTKKKPQIKVADVSEFSLCGYLWEKFDTLPEAFAYVAQEMIDTGAERFEIKVPGSESTIQIDARYVDLDGLNEI